MDTVRESATILREAERGLQRLLTTAVADGDYEAIVKIAGWAKVLAGMLSQLAGQDSARIPRDSVESQVYGHTSRDSSRAPAEPRRRGTKAYPRFYRNGTTIVKIGWSKGSHSEYEHKAPLSVLLDLAKALAGTGSKKSRFTMESVLPLKSSADGSEVPSYQAYLCLALLREQALILQHGRQGYSVKPKTDLAMRTQEMFALLPEGEFRDRGRK